jgi:hypothetical protein
MSANADVLQRSELIGSAAREEISQELEVVRETNNWNAEEFAQEQIRGMVRRVFFATGGATVKQVVFSAAETSMDITNLCERTGRALAQETQCYVAIVGRDRRVLEIQSRPRTKGDAAIKSWSEQMEVNLWRVPGMRARASSEGRGTANWWTCCLAGLRSEFEFAVIQGPAAGISSEAALMGQLADGVVLVLEAHSTRKATACRIKETFLAAHSRILGTVLSERRFPVPERIYRRL